MINIIKTISDYLLKLKNNINVFLEENKKILFYLKFFVIFLLMLWSYYLLSLKYKKNSIGLQIGDIAPYDIKVEENITYIDRKKTQKKIDAAMKKIIPVFKLNMSIINDKRKDIEKFFKKVEEIDAEYNSLDDKVKVFYKYYKIKKSIIKDLFRYYKINYLRDKSINSMIKIYKRGVAQLDYKTLSRLSPTGKIEKTFYNENKEKIYIISNISDIFFYKNLNLTSELRKQYPKLRRVKVEVLANILKLFISPNLFYDKEATGKKRIKIVENIHAVKKHLKKGQIVVRYGEEITESKFNILQELKNYSNRSNIYILRGKFEFLFLFYIMFAILFYRYGGVYFTKDKNFYFIIFYLFFMMTISYFTPMLRNLIKTHIPAALFIPISGIGVLTNLLVMSNMSYWIIVILTILISFITNLNFLNFFVVLITGIFAVIISSKIKRRLYMWYVGLIIGVFYLIQIIALDNILNFNHYQLSNSIVTGFANGILSMILAMGLFPMFEYIFNLLTEYRLLELSDLNSKIMKKLLIEAPGTYNHSILTANLAETAALAIGANSLLARVGGYYHDIGKLVEPEYFIENQDGHNRHSKLKPSISASIIKAHIKKGVELAKKLRLPQEIIDIIREHHGKTIISYFYDQALKNSDTNSISPQELENTFRYPGPKPQTKESAIIMLADSVEAAARALKKTSHSRLETTVRSIIDAKFFDGQLDECPLTLTDLNKIKDSFLQVLSAMFHTRIEYPDIAKKTKRHES